MKARALRPLGSVAPPLLLAFLFLELYRSYIKVGVAKMKAVSELISIRGPWKLAFPSLRLTCSSIGDTWGG